MAVPSIPSVNIGQLLTNSVNISTTVTETNLGNNNSSSTSSIVASYDPNDKTESHGEKIVYSTFTPNDYLTYTIRFENTGTATAENIRVTDVLDSQIDQTSFRMISSSGNYVLDRVGNNLSWKFNNIQLPVSVANTNIGKGYITFKAKLKPGFAVGTTVPNTASIYFDFNPAIITNTFTTLFVQSLNTRYYDFNDLFSLSPVPAKNIVTITTKQAVVISSVSIYNTLGQLVQVNTNPTEVIDVSNLKTGSYFIKIVSDKGMASGKFLKE